MGRGPSFCQIVLDYFFFEGFIIAFFAIAMAASFFIFDGAAFPVLFIMVTFFIIVPQR